jgi:hypothetical protein
MPKLFVYKLTADNGGAPCVTDDLLTLAICKPAIRSATRPGDWIFGFGDNDELQNRLIYIAEVTGKLEKSTYYLANLFSRRQDCIYRRDDTGRLQRRRGARFHSESDKARDVGEFPEYRRANVILSTNFRYFGRMAAPEIPSVLQEFVRAMGQGHRSNFNERPDVAAALNSLRDLAWRKFSQMRIGTPTHADMSRKCNR